MVLGVQLPERLRHLEHRRRQVARAALPQSIAQDDEPHALTSLYPWQRPRRRIEYTLDLPPPRLSDRVRKNEKLRIVAPTKQRKYPLAQGDAVRSHVIRPPRNVLQERSEPVEVIHFQRLRQLGTGLQELARQRAGLPRPLVQPPPHPRPILHMPSTNRLESAVTRIEVARRQRRRRLTKLQTARRPLLKSAKRHQANNLRTGLVILRGRLPRPHRLPRNLQSNIRPRRKLLQTQEAGHHVPSPLELIRSQRRMLTQRPLDAQMHYFEIFHEPPSQPIPLRIRTNPSSIIAVAPQITCPSYA